MSRSDRARQARRDAAMTRPELRLPFGYMAVDRELPPEGKEVTAWAKMPDDRAAYRLPFVFRAGQWFNATQNRPLEVAIVGWCHR